MKQKHTESWPCHTHTWTRTHTQTHMGLPVDALLNTKLTSLVARSRSSLSLSLSVYLCAKMHFCMQHNRNRCGRFNINAVTNDAAKPLCQLSLHAICVSACVCMRVCVCVHCGHYNEIRLQFKRSTFYDHSPCCCYCCCCRHCFCSVPLLLLFFCFGHFRFCCGHYKRALCHRTVRNCSSWQQ